MKNKYTLRYPLAILSLLLLTILPSFAGGFTVKAKIGELTLNKKNWSYSAQLTFVERKDREGKAQPDRQVKVHFHHTKEPMPVTRKKFEAAIAILKQHAKSGKVFDLGVMGSQGGMKKIKGKENEYKSINLTIHDGIVYSHGG